MGTWSSSLYGNDTTCDIRDIYIGFLEEQLSSQEAYEKTLEQCGDYIESQDEALFWFALAESQWKAGRLMPEVKAKALEWIDKGGGLELWEESKSGSRGWKKTLEKLHTKLMTEQRKEKRFKKRVIPNQNPWALNDIYAYRVHVECIAKEERAVHGKYILMQKIGEEKSDHSSDIVMRVQIFDRVFDIMPSIDEALETIQNYRLLPILSRPIAQQSMYKSIVRGIPDSLSPENPFSYVPVITSAKMEQYHKDLSYPQDELTYLCTAEGPLNKQHERPGIYEGYGSGMRSWMWHDLHYEIGTQIASWQGVEYEVVEDGTFEYPTREQQLQIQAEFRVK